MRTKITYLYTFDELSESAQEKAIQNVRENFHDLYAWHDDNVASLKAFAEMLNSKHDYSVSLWGYSYATVKIADHIYYEISDDEEVPMGELKGKALVDFLSESMWKTWKGKAFYIGMESCPFTGYYMDDDLLQPMVDYLQNPDEDTTLQDLVDSGADNWLKSYISDWEYTYSDEGIREFLEANDYEFTEEGKIS